MRLVELSLEEFECNQVADKLAYPLDRIVGHFFGFKKEEYSCIYLGLHKNRVKDNEVRSLQIMGADCYHIENLIVYIVELDSKVKEIMKSKHRTLYYSFFNDI